MVVRVQNGGELALWMWVQGFRRDVDLEGRGAAHAVGVFRVENENGEYGRELT